MVELGVGNVVLIVTDEAWHSCLLCSHAPLPSRAHTQIQRASGIILHVCSPQQGPNAHAPQVMFETIRHPFCHLHSCIPLNKGVWLHNKQTRPGGPINLSQDDKGISIEAEYKHVEPPSTKPEEGQKKALGGLGLARQ